MSVLAVSTADTVGALIILGTVALFTDAPAALVAIHDRVRRRLTARATDDAAGLPDTARHRGRVEAGMSAAAEARTREGRGATPGVRPSAAAPSHRPLVTRCERR